MLHFVYTYTETFPRRDNGSGVRKSVQVFQIKRNEPVLVAERSESYVSEFQLVMQALEHAKAMPRKAFERHQWGGFKYGNASHLREDGIASIHRL